MIWHKTINYWQWPGVPSEGRLALTRALWDAWQCYWTTIEMWEAPKSQGQRFHRKSEVLLIAWLFYNCETKLMKTEKLGFCFCWASSVEWILAQGSLGILNFKLSQKVTWKYRAVARKRSLPSRTQTSNLLVLSTPLYHYTIFVLCSDEFLKIYILNEITKTNQIKPKIILKTLKSVTVLQDTHSTCAPVRGPK